MSTREAVGATPQAKLSTPERNMALQRPVPEISDVTHRQTDTQNTSIIIIDRQRYCCCCCAPIRFWYPIFLPLVKKFLMQPWQQIHRIAAAQGHFNKESGGLQESTLKKHKTLYTKELSKCAAEQWHHTTTVLTLKKGKRPLSLAVDMDNDVQKHSGCQAYRYRSYWSFSFSCNRRNQCS